MTPAVRQVDPKTFTVDDLSLQRGRRRAAQEESVVLRSPTVSSSAELTLSITFVNVRNVVDC